MRTDTLAALRRIDYTWQQRAAISWLSWWTSNNGENLEPSNDPRLVTTTTTLVDTNQVSKQTAINPSSGAVGFDQYNNLTDSREYDYGSGAAGALMRRTHTDYLTSGYDTVSGTNSNPNAAATIHIRSLPTKQQVFDAGGTLRSQTDYEYDHYNQSNPDALHAALTSRTNISGLGAAFTTSYYTRGNVTKTTRQLIDANGNITGAVSAHAQYDVAGNVT